MQIITNKRKNTCFYKIIHFSMQFSAIVNRFIVKTKLNSAFTNDLKRKENVSKNVHSCRLSLFRSVLYWYLMKCAKSTGMANSVTPDQSAPEGRLI